MYLTCEPLLVLIEHRIQFLCRIQAQRARDNNCEQRLDPPNWEDVTMRFASKVLNPPCLSQGSRSHCEKLLHESNWTVKATTSLDRQTLLTCSLCSSPDRRDDDSYDHVFQCRRAALILQLCNNSTSTLSLPTMKSVSSRTSCSWSSLRMVTGSASATGTQHS